MKGIEGRSQKGEVPFPIIVIAHTHGDLFGSGECSNTKRSPQHRKDCHHAKRKSGKGNKSSSETCLPSVKHAEKKSSTELQEIPRNASDQRYKDKGCGGSCARGSVRFIHANWPQRKSRLKGALNLVKFFYDDILTETDVND